MVALETMLQSAISEKRYLSGKGVSGGGRTGWGIYSNEPWWKSKLYFLSAQDKTLQQPDCLQPSVACIGGR